MRFGVRRRESPGGASPGETTNQKWRKEPRKPVFLRPKAVEIPST